MTRNLFALLFLAVLFAICSHTVGQAQTLVGRYGDLSSMEIQAAETFSAEEIRSGLLRDGESLVAAHRLAPLVELPLTIEERLTAGYQRAGFANAKVTVGLDSEKTRLMATVSEGPRYFNGDIRIDNATEISTDQLKARLTQPFSPKEAVTPVIYEQENGKIAYWLDKEGKKLKDSEPVWVEGEPTQWDFTAQKRYAESLRLAFADLGFRDVDFNFALVPSPDAPAADLVVQIHDAGIPAKPVRIEIDGNKRDTDQAILDYLKLSIDTTISTKREARIHHDLWQSGRYISVNVEVQPPSRYEGYVLVLTLVESPFAPAIDQPLSREQQALLKMGRYVSNTENWDSDMVLSAKTENYVGKFILSPQEGFLFSCGLQSTALQAFNLVGSQRELACCLPEKNSLFRVPLLESVARLRLNLKLNQEYPNELDKPFAIKMSAELESNEKFEGAVNSPLDVKLQITPAACIALASAYNAKSSWNDQVLTIETQKGLLEINAQEGTLNSVFRKTEGGALEIAFQPGQYQKSAAALHSMGVSHKNSFKAQQPIRSSTEFLLGADMINVLDELFMAAEDNPLMSYDRKSAEAWHSILLLGLADPLDEFLGHLEKSKQDDKFMIPITHRESSTDLNYIALLAMGFTNELFPYDCWVCHVSSETCLALSGHGKYVEQALQYWQKSEEIGPCGCLTIAFLLKQGGMQNKSQAFARRAKQHLSLIHI